MRDYIAFSIVVSIVFCAPVLAYDWSTNPGDGSPENPYQISTPEQFNAIGASSSRWHQHFVLVANIDLSAYIDTEYNVIGNIIGSSYKPFTGTFEGNGHVIANLTYSSSNKRCIGLFGYISNAVIMNLGVENINIISENNCAGGLVGYQDESTITNCYTTGSVRSSHIENLGPLGAGGLVGEQRGGEIVNCYSSASVSGLAYAGGLVGYGLFGTIINSYATGTVISAKYTGGLVGYIGKGAIENCYSMGDVTASSYYGDVLYSTGSVFGGGLVGYNSKSLIVKSLSAGKVVCSSDDLSYSGGLTGLVHSGEIVNCCSFASVSSKSATTQAVAGGLVGYLYHETSKITTSYSTGHVIAEGPRVYEGGLIGRFAKGSIISSFWDTQTSGLATSDGGIGRTTAQMQTQNTFKGWDFGMVWYMGKYPVLQWELNPLQGQIDAAQNGDMVIVEPGIYKGQLYIKGKNITFASVDPSDPNIIAATILRGKGVGSVVNFDGTEDGTCVLEGFTITGGYTMIKGGGVNGNQTLASIRRCIIDGNTAYASAGGGIGGVSGLIENCVIRNNQAVSGGGLAKCGGIIRNSLIYGNMATERGFALNNCDGFLQNCTIIGSNTEKKGLVAHCDGLFDSCVLYCKLGTIFVNNTASTQYCCWPEATGEDDTNAAPMFIDPNDENYRLMANSPCINAGNPSYISDMNNVDLDGNARLIGLCVDIGAYEFPNTVPIADAGVDITTYAFVGGYALVQLDGSGSYDEDGDVLEYYWYNDANELIGTRAEPNVLLSAGEHMIDLIVNDGIEDSEPNSCVVKVIEPFETTVKMLPGTINLKSKRSRIIGRIEFTGEAMPVLDPNEPMLLLVGDVEIEALAQKLVYSEENNAWYLTGFFDNAMVIETIERLQTSLTPSPLRGTPPWQGESYEVTLVSRFGSGQWIYGRDMVKLKR